MPNFTGDSSNNLVNGGGGDDIVSGLNGDDTLYGGAGNDSILGGEGHDSLYGEQGNDTIDGGNGWDRAVFSGNLSDYSVAFNPSLQTVNLNTTTDVKLVGVLSGDVDGSWASA